MPCGKSEIPVFRMERRFLYVSEGFENYRETRPDISLNS